MSRPRSRKRFPSKAELTPGHADEAVQAALRLLRHRDRSAAQVARELEARGFGPQERTEALDALTRTGLVDDRRYAERRAEALAARGAGDALIAYDLAVAGISSDVIAEVVEAVEDEVHRAARIVERRGRSAKAARYLASKGFSEDVVRGVIAHAPDEGLG